MNALFRGVADINKRIRIRVFNEEDNAARRGKRRRIADRVEDTSAMENEVERKNGLLPQDAHKGIARKVVDRDAPKRRRNRLSNPLLPRRIKHDVRIVSVALRQMREEIDKHREPSAALCAQRIQCNVHRVAGRHHTRL